MYFGAFVQNNAIHVILRAAHILQSEGNNRVRFVLIGGGQEKANLVKLSQDLSLTNVEFRDVVTKSELPRVMNEADAFVLCMQNLPRLYKYGISWNKLCDYLVSGRPILFAGNPAYNPVRDFRAGIVVPPENPAALAQATKELVALPPAERLRMGENALRYVKEHHDVRSLADRLEATLQSVIGEGTRFTASQNAQS
jgi:glycosyltransferase involved in cell wall biosynthesis